MITLSSSAYVPALARDRAHSNGRVKHVSPAGFVTIERKLWPHPSSPGAVLWKRRSRTLRMVDRDVIADEMQDLSRG